MESAPTGSVPSGLAPSPGDASASPAEVVRRPDPGLARGVWEMRPALFYILGAAVVLAAALYAMARLRWLRRRSAQAVRKAGD